MPTEESYQIRSYFVYKGEQQIVLNHRAELCTFTFNEGTGGLRITSFEPLSGNNEQVTIVVLDDHELVQRKDTEIFMYIGSTWHDPTHRFLHAFWKKEAPNAN